jgi:hypothetical protein
MKAVAEELVGPLADFRSAYAINRSLGKLYAIAAENRIPPRNAAILAYIGQLLLQTLTPLRQEAIEMGMAGRTHAIFNDAMNHIGDESPTPSLTEKVEESLAMIKNAGISFPPSTIRELRSGVEEEADEDDDAEEADDGAESSERSEI